MTMLKSIKKLLVLLLLLFFKLLFKKLELLFSLNEKMTTLSDLKFSYILLYFKFKVGKSTILC